MFAASEALKIDRQRFKTSWEQTRLIAFYAIAPSLKRKLRSSKELFKLPWDSEPTNRPVPKITPQHIALQSKLDRIADKHAKTAQGNLNKLRSLNVETQ